MNRKINWEMRSEEERQLFNYYTSLNFDERTATVLTLFTYGSKAIPRFSIPEAYKALVNGEEYTPTPPTPPSGPVAPFPIDEIEQSDFDLFDVKARAASSGPVFCGNGKDANSTENTSSSILQCLRDFKNKIHERTNRLKHASFAQSDDLGVAAFESMDNSDEYCEIETSGNFDTSFSGISTDEYQLIEEKDFRNTMREFSSTFRMTTNTASTGIVFNQLRIGRTIDRSMVRIEEMLNYFRYLEAKPEEEVFRIDTELKGRDNGRKLLYIHVQGKEEIREKQNITVLLDVSGSMSGNEKQTQATLATIISKLKIGDTFSLVTYSNTDQVVLDGVKVVSEKSITCFLEKLLGMELGGGTYGSAGIEKAYQIGKRNYLPGGNNQVILITDGDLNFGITSQGGLEKLIEEKKKDHLFLSVIGTGLYNYKDNKLETLSKHGNGVYRVVNNLNDVKKSVRDEYASLVNVIAKDVKAQVEFNPEKVESFRLLGFENRELLHEEFADDTVVSEPFGSGGYGVALYELKLREDAKQQSVVNRYTQIVTTGSKSLATVSVRYKEPLEDVSHVIEHIIADAEERWTDNILLAGIVYVCAEKLRDSKMIDAQDEESALVDLEKLGDEIKKMNQDDLDKLYEILRRNKAQLGAAFTRYAGDFDW